MADIKKESKYIIKNAHGKLQMKSELELIELLAKKLIAPETKVFVMMLNQWAMVKDLCLFTKKATYARTKEFDVETNFVDSEINIEFNKAVDYIHLLDNYENAKEIAKKVQIDYIEKLNDLEIECSNKKERIRYLENINQTYAHQQKTLQKDFQELQNTLEKINRVSIEKNARDSEITKLQVELNKLNVDREITTSDIGHFKQINEELLNINQSLKHEYLELLKQREQISLENEKILVEQKFYQEKATEKDLHIQRLQTELSLLKNLYQNAVDKFENYSFDYTEYKKQVGIYRLDLDVLNIERDRLHEEIRKLNEDSKRLTTQLNHVKTEIENKDIEIEKLTKTIKLSIEEKKLLSDHNKNLINETKILNEQIKQLKSLPPVPSDYIPMSQHEENLRKQEEKLKADFSHQLTTNQYKAEKELQELIKKVEILERESVLLQSNFNIAQQEKNELQELCRTQNIKIKKLISFKDYAAKKMSETITSYNSKIVDYKNTLSKQKNEYSKVISKLKDVKEDEVKIDELLAVQSNMADSNKIEDIDSVGELFEVSNDKIWKIKSKELNQNLYSILDLKTMLDENEITPDTSIKKLGESWKKVSETFEMNTTLLTKHVGDELRIFIKREDFRIPCSFQLKLDYLGQEFKAVCTNLSASGCFITLQNSAKSIIDEGGVMKIQFPKFESSKTIPISCEIKRIEKADFIGCGLKFSNMNAEIKSFIDTHLQVFSASLKKSA